MVDTTTNYGTQKSDGCDKNQTEMMFKLLHTQSRIRIDSLVQRNMDLYLPLKSTVS